MRVRDISEYAWAEFVEVANAGTSFRLAVAKLNGASRGGGGGGVAGVTEDGTRTACSSPPGVSPRPSATTARGGRVTPGVGELPPANPLQAAFFNRVCLLDIDDEHKAKLKRWWHATRTWSWGYEKQRRIDINNAQQERQVREERAAREAKREAVAAAAAAEDKKEKEKEKAAAAEAELAALNSGKNRGSTTPVAIPVRGSLSAQRSMQRPGGGLGGAGVGARDRVSPARGGLVSGGSALGRMWQRRHDGGATGQAIESESSQQGQRGLPRLLTAPPAAGLGDLVQGSGASSGADRRHHRPVASVSVGPIISTETAGASGEAAAETGLAADWQKAQQSDSSAARDSAGGGEGETPQPVDWARDVWSQCRLHRVSTSPLLLPMASSTLRGFSVKGSPHEGDTAGEEASLIVEANRSPPCSSLFSGPHGGTYAEEGRRWGLGMWPTSRGSLGRQTPGGAGGSGAVGSVSEKDSVTSPKEWGASSHNSPVATQHSGSVAASSRDRRLTQSELEDISLLRSRSATSSGPGRDSFDSNNADAEERWEPAQATSVALALQVAAREDLPSFPGFSRAFGSSCVSDGGLDSGGGELRQTRSTSLAGLGWDAGGGFGGEAGGNSFSTLRRKSSAVDNTIPEAGATPGSAAASTPKGRRESVGVDAGAARTADAERAAVFARQFVRAYSAYLVEYLDFTLMGGPVNGVTEPPAAAAASTVGNNDAPGTRHLFAGQTATPPSNQGLGARRGWDERPGHGGDSSADRVNEQFCSPATRGGGGELLAHALLRLPFVLTNTVALVEVSVMVAPTTSSATAAAAEPMQASVKFWTVDVDEPSDGWEGDGPAGGGVPGQSPSRSWWAHLPTLTSFKWNLDPDNPTYLGYDLPEELPHDMYRVIHKLRLRNSVEDFVVGQVSQSASLFDGEKQMSGMQPPAWPACPVVSWTVFLPIPSTMPGVLLWM